VLRVNADENTAFASSPVDADVAIIDTGIELTHPDLNVFKNVTYVRRTSSGNDDNGHGTHVAGTVAALDNSIGVVGVAPGARLWGVKVLDKNGSGYTSDVIKGVDYVTANAASIEVANMSLGGGNSPSLNAAIASSVAQGVVYVVAAGNSAADAGNYSPANSPDVLCVSAIVDTDGTGGGLGPGTSYGADDTFASFSNYGSVVDIAAPGVNIFSTYKGQTYATLSGTSMASPHVAGVVALALAESNKPLNADDVALVRQFIISNGSLQNSASGFSGDRDAIAEPLANALFP
jgi:subtilisin family serine protease